MDDKYFETLKNSIPNSEQSASNVTNGSGHAFLTVKVDIDCKLYCDGDFLDLFEANKVKKIPIETGQHLMTVESEHCDGVSEDHVVDAAEAGKNYLLLVNGLKEKEQDAALKAKENKQRIENLNRQEEHIKKVLTNFGIVIKKIKTITGLTSTRFEIALTDKTLVDKINYLKDDIHLSLSSYDNYKEVHITAPINDDGDVCIELPNNSI
jgi:hypothetical protein